MIIIISFFLEGIVSNYIPISSMFFPLFTLISFVVASYYYKEEIILKMSFIIGLLYDITYTNTLGLHMLLFYSIVYFLLLFHKKLKNNFFNFLWIGIFTIGFYLSMSYFILLLIGYLEFDAFLLLNAFKNCILFNVIYLLVMYSMEEIIHRKKR